MKPRYEVIESRCWQHTSGAQASLYGSIPWTRESEKADWQIVQAGWTVRNTREGTIGIGRVPWPDRESAQAWADAENARLAAIAAQYVK